MSWKTVEGDSAIIECRRFAVATRSASGGTIDQGSTSGIAVFFCRKASRSRSNTAADHRASRDAVPRIAIDDRDGIGHIDREHVEKLQTASSEVSSLPAELRMPALNLMTHFILSGAIEYVYGQVKVSYAFNQRSDIWQVRIGRR
jgi:hypothetical protein